ncbi:hypothetical protein, partial [Acinetobacter baumannii]|uniref:hypothetical protein n=1 Tax=Acinetobacter baumannii TaxID=470 RepID=UPI001C0735E6
SKSERSTGVCGADIRILLRCDMKGNETPRHGGALPSQFKRRSARIERSPENYLGSVAISSAAAPEPVFTRGKAGEAKFGYSK